MVKFQSYQFRQINPDVEKRLRLARYEKHVSIVSIQTDQSRRTEEYIALEDCTVVSIVSIQTDQSRLYSMKKIRLGLSSFNRINSDRSIPTLIMSMDILRQFILVSIVSIQTDQSRRKTILLSGRT